MRMSSLTLTIGLLLPATGWAQEAQPATADRLSESELPEVPAVAAAAAIHPQVLAADVPVMEEVTWMARPPARFSTLGDEVSVAADAGQDVFCAPPAGGGWKAQYSQGRKLAQIGLKAGLIGGLVTVVSVPVALFADLDGNTGLFVTSAIAGGGGLVMLLGGAPLAAYGVTQSHRALASADLVSGRCQACIGSWISYATTPLPLIGVVGLGVSYGFSSAQLKKNDQVYQRSQSSLPNIHLQPLVSSELRGLSLVGTF